MFKFNWVVLILLFTTPNIQAAESHLELKQQVKLLIEQVQNLQAKVQEMAIKQQEYETKIQRKRVQQNRM